MVPIQDCSYTGEHPKFYGYTRTRDRHPLKGSGDVGFGESSVQLKMRFRLPRPWTLSPEP